MRHLLYIFTIVTILHACNNVSDKTLTVPNGVKTDYSTEAVISHTLHINVPSNKFSGYNSIFLFKDKYLYGVNNSCLNVIDVYDIQNQSYIQDITIDRKNLEDRISGLYVYSPDSIYFCQVNPNNIYLTDRKGTIINHWTHDDLKIKISDDELLSKYDITFTSFLGQSCPLVLGNQIIIGLDPSGMYKINGNLKRIGIYNMDQRQWVKFLSKASDVESNIKGLGYPYDLEQPYIADGDGCIIISYPMDHYIYIYSKDTYEFISKIPCFSRYVNEFPYPLPPDQINSCQKNWNFRIQTPFYGAVNYHQNKGIYTRIVYHPQSLIGEDGNINDGTGRTSSVIIMDNKFQIIGETLFEDGQIGVYSYLPMTTGLLVSPQLNNDHNTMLNYRNIITFE